jgi:radical SAM-linked protein
VRNVTYHMNGAKGADHRGTQVDDWAKTILPEHDTWGTRQWQTMQEKRRHVNEWGSERKGEREKKSSHSPTPPFPHSFSIQPPTPDPRPPVSGNAEDWLAGDPNTVAITRAEKKPAVARVRLTYSKLDEARFLGAREVATLFARATRRARLPVAYSQGFHPLPRLSFGPALPMGVESEEEFLDIELSEPLTATEVGWRLGTQLSRGFTVRQVVAIGLHEPSIDASIRAFRYAVALNSLPKDKQEPTFLEQRLSAFRVATALPMRKHSRGGEKMVDAKDFVAEVTLSAPSTLYLETQITGAGTIKPHEFVGLLLELTQEEVKVLRLKKIHTLFHPTPIAFSKQQEEKGTETPLSPAAN